MAADSAVTTVGVWRGMYILAFPTELMVIFFLGRGEGVVLEQVRGLDTCGPESCER